MLTMMLMNMMMMSLLTGELRQCVLGGQGYLAVMPQQAAR